MALARRKLTKGSASKTATIWKTKMNSGEHSSKGERSSGPRLILSRFAEARGGAGFVCARAEEVGPALEAAWRVSDRPALVEATIDNDADVSPHDDYLAHARCA
jgi:thiamine pyrophosphate-dependent acetolactate synthase large subunit-like protein